MSTDPPPAPGRLSPSWFPSFSRSKKPASNPSGKSNAGGLLVPQPTSSSTKSGDSDGSRSTLSNSSRRGSVQDMVNRFRSSSSTSTTKPRTKSPSQGPSRDLKFKQAEDWFQGFDKYNQLVTTHVSRNQLYPSEEFAWVCETLSDRCEGRFLHGLPEAVIDLALLWCPAGNLTRNESNEPTWSWAAWNGQVNFPFDPTNCPEHYRLPVDEGKWFKSEITNYHVGPETTSAQYTVRREKREPKLRMEFPPWFHAPLGSAAGAGSNTLRFTASSISAENFKTVQRLHKDKKIPCSQLVDENDRHCGIIMEYEEHIAEPYPHEDISFEFILLSRNRRVSRSSEPKPTRSTIHPPGTPIWDGERFLPDLEEKEFDENKFEDGPWKVLNVMLIMWLEGGKYAERIAIGRIHEDAWSQRHPVRKEIALK